MSIANQKGGFNVTLRVTQNGSAESMCVLQKPILKKAENWSLQITDLFINKTPALNRQLNEQLRIVPIADGGVFSAGYRPSDYIFTPENCYTVMEYVIQLQQFFNRFSFLFWRYGIANSLGTTPEQEAEFITGASIATTAVNYTHSNYVRNPDWEEGDEDGDEFVDEGYNNLIQICSASLDSDLKLRIHLKTQFLANFYIRLQDHFATRMGFPPILYLIVIDGQEQHEPPEVFGELDAFIIQARIPPAGQTVVSDKTIRELDDRVSLDLFSTFPASRKINVVNGVEQHEYLLARFDLSDYKTFESLTTHTSTEMVGSTEITETYEGGLENMTRGNPDYESNHLLSGSLQHVHLMLRTRYNEQGVMKTIPTEMNDGFWHCKMLFSKKL